MCIIYIMNYFIYKYIKQNNNFHTALWQDIKENIGGT